MDVNIGVLHPGAMGASIAAALAGNGHRVLWCAHGRTDATARRANEAGCERTAQLDDLVGAADAIVAVCPPEAAHTVAGAVAAAGFRGLYVDANAVSPASAAGIAERHPDAFVDGGIIGPPALVRDTTRLYLSGARAAEVADWFAGSVVDARVMVAADAGAASALKMAYASYTKGLSALLLNVRALARSQGVEAALLEEWALSQPGLAQRSAAAAIATAPKAWRFVGEMAEIAATYRDASLPGEFHDGAGALYERLRGFRDAAEPHLEDVLAALLDDTSTR